MISLIKSIIFAQAQVILNLETGKVIDCSTHPQLLNALEVLAKGNHSKASLFKALWGNQKYVPQLHDGLIFGLQQRLKSKFRIKMSMGQSQIKVFDVMVIHQENDELLRTI